jgi:DNA-binding LacI/PurR family transcriptional regulator
MDEARLTVGDEWIVMGEFQHASGYHACQQLLQLADRPTAVFACNDLMAVGAMYAIHEAGLHVPNDVSVIGYDDIPLASYTIPRLTTVAQPAREIGTLAVERLIDALRDEPSPPKHECLPVNLVLRDSCAQPR